MQQEQFSATEPVGLEDVLALEWIEQDLYRSCFVYEDQYALYGGQVAAQALHAAGLTVPDGRVPHSLHGYFLRGGASEKPTVLSVHRDRDGRSYSARRVVALQDGEVIFSMSASFAVPETGADIDLDSLDGVPGPDGLPQEEIDFLRAILLRTPPQPPEATLFPSRFWARSKFGLPDSPLIHACVLTYLSDAYSGLHSMPHGERSGSSLDHSVWFHRPAKLDEWVLMDLVPHTVSGGRGWYTGTIRAADGSLLASLAQEALFRTPRRDS
jgi:acyl-CoA thioesterase-2